MCCIVRPTCTTLRARAAASTLQPARCTATVYCREAFQKQPWRSGHRGPTQGRHTSWCATIVDRDWRPAHGIPSSLSLDSLPTTILRQPPIPPSPTYNMTLCSYKADRPHDPILKSEECVAKSARHAPPCKSLLPASRHSRVLISLTPHPPSHRIAGSAPTKGPDRPPGGRARTTPAWCVVPRPVSPDPKSSDGILCGCSIICSTVTIFAGASRRQSAARGEFPGGKHF